MAVSEKQHNELTSRTHRVEVILKIVGAPLLCWIAWLSVTLFSIKGDMQAIKQKIKDGGLGDIVSKLENSPSQADLVHNLAIISAEVSVNRLKGDKDDPEKVAKLSSAVRKVAIANPTLPEVWQTAFQLVSYRSQVLQFPVRNELPNCLDSPTPLAQFRNTIRDFGDKAQAPKRGDIGLSGSDCILDLDSNDSYENSPGWQYFKEVNERFPGSGVFINLQRAVITYSGGRMIPLDRLSCTACIFDFKVPAVVPPKGGQELTDQLLTADLTQVNVNLHAGF